MAVKIGEMLKAIEKIKNDKFLQKVSADFVVRISTKKFEKHAFAVTKQGNNQTIPLRPKLKVLFLERNLLFLNTKIVF